MRKSRRQTMWRVLVTLFIVGIVSYRMVKIVQKEEKKQALAESVTPSIVWDIKLTSGEFIGDLSQVGTYLVYARPGDEITDARTIHILRLDDGSLTIKKASDEDAPATTSLIVGHSKLGKKEFRIEDEDNRSVVAQYNIATKTRGLIAKLPENCSDFKTVQRLPKNFFVLVGLCSSISDHKQLFKRIIVVDFETRRLPYISGLLDKDIQFVAFK